MTCFQSWEQQHKEATSRALLRYDKIWRATSDGISAIDCLRGSRFRHPGHTVWHGAAGGGRLAEIRSQFTFAGPWKDDVLFVCLGLPLWPDSLFRISKPTGPSIAKRVISAHLDVGSSHNSVGYVPGGRLEKFQSGRPSVSPSLSGRLCRQRAIRLSVSLD